jgi:hypothetical protein
MKKQQLIDLVIEEIKKDIASGDVTALDELLQFVPLPSLKAYLPEPEPSNTVYKFPRRCDVTGKGMWEGYCFGDGQDYAIDKAGATTLAMQYGYETLEEAFEDGAYYFTAWEELDEDEWFESMHEDGRNAYAVSGDEG